MAAIDATQDQAEHVAVLQTVVDALVTERDAWITYISCEDPTEAAWDTYEPFRLQLNRAADAYRKQVQA